MIIHPIGMPPWWNKHIACRHCGVYIIGFTPTRPDSWKRELEERTESASERCYCRRPYEELQKLLQEPVDRMKEHTWYRTWLSWAIRHRRTVHGEGGGRSTFEWTSPIAGEWSDKSTSTAGQKRSARRSEKKR